VKSLKWFSTLDFLPSNFFQLPFPGVFGVFYETDRPTKNALEKKWIKSSREKTNNASDLELLQKTFDRMK